MATWYRITTPKELNTVIGNDTIPDQIWEQAKSLLLTTNKRVFVQIKEMDGMVLIGYREIKVKNNRLVANTRIIREI